ncbi:MAG: thioredoxin domain-containing protein [Thiohalomonadales bacterium]
MHKLILLVVITFLIATQLEANTNTSQQINICERPIEESKINGLFHELATKQLHLEFGAVDLTLYDESHVPISPDLYQLEAYAKFLKPGRKNLSTMRIIAWMSICQGTLIIRGNTWLANGSLAVHRYSKIDLPGSGLLLGSPTAQTKLIAFVDSRCPHCHRLITYARELIKDGRIQIEIRQVAYLESIEESLRDTRVSESRLVQSSGYVIGDGEYLDMLTGLSNEGELDRGSEAYRKAKSIVEINTKTAKTILHVTSVPALLVLDNNKQYRLTSYWEMNRLLQPGL